MQTWKSTSLGVAALAAMTIAGPAKAAEFPTKPVTILVGFAAGGGTDAVVRAMAEPLAKSLGQTVLVQNKPGAGGAVAAMAVKTSEPDGYTLIGTGSLTYAFDPLVLKAQYNVKDLAHIAIVSKFEDGLFTHPSRPYKSMRDVINAAKAEKRDIKYASQYQLDKLIFEYVAKKEGIKIIPVPTGGGNGAVQAVLANQVDFGFSGGTFGPQAETGAVRVIGSMMTERMGRFPDIPSMVDNGWNIGGGNYLILSAPKNTPKPVVDKLAKAMAEAAKAPNVQAAVRSRYMKENLFIGPDKIDATLDADIKKFTSLLEQLK